MSLNESSRPTTPKKLVSVERGEYPHLRPVGDYQLGGNALDRFIPQQASKKAYRASPSLKRFDIRESELLDKTPSPEKLSTPNFFRNLRTTGNYDAISHGNYGDHEAATPNTSISISRNSYHSNSIKLSPDQKRHREYIADCLGFQSSQRVLRFHSPHTNREVSADDGEEQAQKTSGECKTFSMWNQHHHYLRVDPIATALPPSRAILYLGTSAFSKMNQSLSFVSNSDQERPSKRVKSRIPYRVLDAPCLRNDFYSNLISWSQTTDNVMVGLGCSVYIWSDGLGAVPVLKHEYLNDKKDIVTCVSFCPQSSFFIVGTKQGRILLFDQKICMEGYRKRKRVLDPLCEYQTHTLRGISCVQWFMKCSASKFFVGEESGIISCLAINENSPMVLPKKKYDIQSLSEEESASPSFQDDRSTKKRKLSHYFECIFKFQAQSQQVCGISLMEEDKLLAVGGNDNSCTLWDISVARSPKLRFILPHNAAVKAVAFCPWSKSLLATGAGSKDRKIRFWHTKTGTLLDEIQTSGQITALIWSTRFKQIVATFGFGDIEDPVMIILYSYPKLMPLQQVRSSTPLRVLSAVASPSMSSICIAANDETIRFYELWNEKEDVISEAQESGIYGSNIIDYVEGIDGFYRGTIR